jgi:two-component system, LytTR family, sensor histidine kinase AlgZ
MQAAAESRVIGERGWFEMTATKQAPGTHAVGGPYLPDFCGMRVVLAVIVGAELLAILLTLGELKNPTLETFYEALSLRTLFIQWVAISGALLLCLLRGQLNRLPADRAGVLAWAILLGVTGLAVAAARAVAGEIFPAVAGGGFVLRSLAISAIVSALILRYLYLHHQWRRQVEAEAQARLQALQSRIRPHFLFNSMNTIAQLTRSDPPLAERVVEDLADLFRASLSDARCLSTLGEELELARGYLRIEGQRLGTRLQVEWQLAGLPEEMPVPALLLQPLLENAVYHGIEPSAVPGLVRVAGRPRGDGVELEIANSLPAAGASSHRNGNHLALENIRQRLAGCYGEAASLQVEEAEGLYRLRLRLPGQLKGGRCAS